MRELGADLSNATCARSDEIWRAPGRHLRSPRCSRSGIGSPPVLCLHQLPADRGQRRRLHLGAGALGGRVRHRWPFGFIPHRFASRPDASAPPFSPACSCTAAGRTWAATCCSSGSSATTSRTRSATFDTCSFTSGGIGGGADADAVDPASNDPDGRRIGGDRRACSAAYLYAVSPSPITVLNPFSSRCGSSSGCFFELPAWLVVVEFFVVNLLAGFELVRFVTRTGSAGWRSSRTSAGSWRGSCWCGSS